MKNFFTSLFLSSFFLSIPIAGATSIGLAPYNGADDNNGYVEVSAYPGASVDLNFIITNGNDYDSTFEIDIVDSTKSDTGTFALKDASEAKIELGLWGKLPTPMISLLAGENQILQGTITVPATQALGEYWGGITAIEVADPSTEGTIASVARIGLRVHLTVVAEEAYVEPAPLDDINSDTTSNNYSKYIIPGLLILVASIVMAIHQSKERGISSDKKKKKTGK